MCRLRRPLLSTCAVNPEDLGLQRLEGSGLPQVLDWLMVKSVFFRLRPSRNPASGQFCAPQSSALSSPKRPRPCPTQPRKPPNHPFRKRKPLPLLSTVSSLKFQLDSAWANGTQDREFGVYTVPDVRNLGVWGGEGGLV